MWFFGALGLACGAVMLEVGSAWIPVLRCIPWLALAGTVLLSIRPQLGAVLPGVLFAAGWSDVLLGIPLGQRASLWVAIGVLTIPLLRRWAYERRPLHLVSIAVLWAVADRLLFLLLTSRVPPGSGAMLLSDTAWSIGWAIGGAVLIVRLLPKWWVFSR